MLFFMLKFKVNGGKYMVILDRITHCYTDALILENINFEIISGEILYILGPSGTGKTTLLNIISGLVTPISGKIDRKFSKLSYVFQEDRLLPWLTVEENIKLVNPKINLNDFQLLIQNMSLEKDVNKKPNELSGGMKQRTSIARALAYDPDILLMDEPFRSLDFGIKENILSSLSLVLKKNNTAMVSVTHDIEEAVQYADRIVLLGGHPSKIELITSKNEIDKSKMLQSIKAHWEDKIEKKN